MRNTMNLDEIMHRAYTAGQLRHVSGIRCRQCGTFLETAYHEERLYSVRCGICEYVTLVKAQNPTSAVLKATGYREA